MPLWVTEGVRKADAALSAGLQAVVSIGGVWNWRGRNSMGGVVTLADWDDLALNGRTVYVCFDSDVATNTKVQAALRRLCAMLARKGAIPGVVYLPAGPDGAKVGLDDYLAAGHTADELLALAEPAAGGNGGAGDKAAKPPKQSHLLIGLATGAGCQLFHDVYGREWATFVDSGHQETGPIRRGAFRAWLRRLFYIATGNPVSREGLQETVEQLAADALIVGPVLPVHLRIAEHDGAIYVDLGNAAREVVKITRSGWSIETECPVKFYRPKGMLPHPRPVAGGSVELLRPFVNVAGGADDPDDDDWRLLIGWIVGAYKPTGPYRMLTPHGRQDSGKTLLTMVAHRMTDPSMKEVSGLPRNEDDLLVACQHSRVLSYDNTGAVPCWFSQAICRVATGGSLSKRENYSDADEVILYARAPLIMNGIGDFADAPDFLSRAISIELPEITDDQYKDEDDYWAEFDAVRPLVFGALLTAVSAALANFSDTKVAARVRMKAYARWVQAAEPALGWPAGAFVEALVRNAAKTSEVALNAEPITEPLCALVLGSEPKPGTKQKPGTDPWTGTATMLLHDLANLVDEGTLKHGNWPGNAQSLSMRLEKIAPNLRERGVTIERNPSRKGGRTITVASLSSKERVPRVPRVPQQSNDGGRDGGRNGDAMGDARDASGDAGDAMGDAGDAMGDAISGQKPHCVPRFTEVGDAGDAGDANLHTKTGEGDGAKQSSASSAGADLQSNSGAADGDGQMRLLPVRAMNDGTNVDGATSSPPLRRWQCGCGRASVTAECVNCGQPRPDAPEWLDPEPEADTAVAADAPATGEV